jgi:hypothetical protein
VVAGRIINILVVAGDCFFRTARIEIISNHIIRIEIISHHFYSTGPSNRNSNRNTSGPKDNNTANNDVIVKRNREKERRATAEMWQLKEKIATLRDEAEDVWGHNADGTKLAALLGERAEELMVRKL